MTLLQPILLAALNGSTSRIVTLDEIYQACQGIVHEGLPIDYMDVKRLMKKAFLGRELVEFGTMSIQALDRRQFLIWQRHGRQ